MLLGSVDVTLRGPPWHRSLSKGAFHLVGANERERGLFSEGWVVLAPANPSRRFTWWVTS